MIPLDSLQDYLLMLLSAAAMGALGGLAYELITDRSGTTGALETPGPVDGTRLYDIGFFASALVGAVTALALMYFFPPEIVLQVSDGSEVTTQTRYELIRLVALSLLAGAAGPSLLTSATSRVLLALQAQKVETVSEAGKQELQRFLEQAKQENSQLLKDLLNQLSATGAGSSDEVLESGAPSIDMRPHRDQLARQGEQLAAAAAARLERYEDQGQRAISNAVARR